MKTVSIYVWSAGSSLLYHGRKQFTDIGMCLYQTDTVPTGANCWPGIAIGLDNIKILFTFLHVTFSNYFFPSLILSVNTTNCYLVFAKFVFVSLRDNKIFWSSMTSSHLLTISLWLDDGPRYYLNASAYRHSVSLFLYTSWLHLLTSTTI